MLSRGDRYAFDNRATRIPFHSADNSSSWWFQLIYKMAYRLLELLLTRFYFHS